MVARRVGREAPHDVFLVAERDGPIRCAKGMRVLADKTIAACGALDVLLVPGGQGTRREVGNKLLLD
jgi:putative intracellular protease/amidase